MTITIHIPDELLTALDRKVKQLRISRNKFFCMMLRKELASDWPKEFKERKLKPSAALDEGVREMLKIIQTNRVNKKGQTL